MPKLQQLPGFLAVKVIRQPFRYEDAREYTVRLPRDACVAGLQDRMSKVRDFARRGWKPKGMRFAVHRPWGLEYVEMEDGEELADLAEEDGVVYLTWNDDPDCPTMMGCD